MLGFPNDELNGEDLINAVQNRNNNLVRMLLIQDPLITNIYKGQALYLAVEKGLHEVTTSLLTLAGEQIPDGYKGPALVRAVKNGNEQMVKTLLAHFSNENKGSAIRWAIENGDNDAANTILSLLSFDEDLASILNWADNPPTLLHTTLHANRERVTSTIVNFVLEIINQKSYCTAILDTLLPKVLTPIMSDYAFSSIDSLLSALKPELAQKVGLTKEKIDAAVAAGYRQGAESAKTPAAPTEHAGLPVAAPILEPVVAPVPVAAPLLYTAKNNQRRKRKQRETEVQSLHSNTASLTGLRRSARLAKMRAKK